MPAAAQGEELRDCRDSGTLKQGVTAKDIILYVISKIGTAGGSGCVIEYTGSAIRSLNMDGRMTVCNMSIEGGARAGMVAPDDTTFEYLAGRPMAPQGAEWDKAVARWRGLTTDAECEVRPHRSPSMPPTSNP